MKLRAFVIQHSRNDVEDHPWRTRKLDGRFDSRAAAQAFIDDVLVPSSDTWWSFRVRELGPGSVVIEEESYDS